MMEDILKKSIGNLEFIDFRKKTLLHEREKYSKTVRDAGLGNVPMLIDSVEELISIAITNDDSFEWVHYRARGRKMVMYMDLTINDLIKEIRKVLIEHDIEKNIEIALEKGDILKRDEKLGDIYKKHRNQKDKILYLLVTTETGIYGYLKSIIRYIMKMINV